MNLKRTMKIYLAVSGGKKGKTFSLVFIFENSFSQILSKNQVNLSHKTV